uniref:Uncharacterized protein n=1 Tax=Rhizophora mucronata TaxID=61149 RepID=A0A2P2N9W3_RHIMU
MWALRYRICLSYVLFCVFCASKIICLWLLIVLLIIYGAESIV